MIASESSTPQIESDSTRRVGRNASVKRALLCLLALSSSYLQSLAEIHGAESTKPNVVMIYIDDKCEYDGPNRLEGR